MPLSVIPPVLFIAALFLFLPFAGENRFFSMPVDAEWLADSRAKHIRRVYQLTVLLVGAACVGGSWLSRLHPLFLFAVPLFEVGSLIAVWSWGWTRTLPHRLEDTITRTAVLRPRVATQTAWWWSLSALLPICGTALFLFSRYNTLPASFPIHFSAEGVPDHIVSRSWGSVFGPVVIGSVVVVLLAGILRAIKGQGAGIADKGRYSTLTWRYVVGVAWMVALECSAAVMLPCMSHPGVYAARLGRFSGTAALVLLLITTGVFVRNKSVLVSGQMATDPACWKGGVLYFNPDDAALFVPKRLGFGWTLNMARPAAWLLMALVLAIPLLGRVLTHL